LTVRSGKATILLGEIVDEKKFLNLLKNLQSIMKCPSCGSVYEVSEMQFVGSQDGYFLLSLTCHDCNLPVWVNFFAGNNQSSNYIAGDLTVSDFRLLSREAISSSEVIDFHLQLKKFDGNFKKAFK
jgi:hypothetical protein